MIVPFRQGIIQYNSINNIQQFLSIVGNNISLNIGQTPVIATAAHLDTDYEIIEPLTISSAWTLQSTNVECWLYWDINTLNADRTFGITYVPPIFDTIPPTNPVNDQHWFNTDKCTMNVYSSESKQWSLRIRVFAAHYDTGTFVSMSFGHTIQTFKGTQVGLNTNGTNIGPIIFDNNGKAVQRANGTFFTTVTSFFTTSMNMVSTHLDTTSLRVRASENIYLGALVVLLPDYYVRLATYDDIGNQIIAIASEVILRYNIGLVTLRGTISCSIWNWGEQQTGMELWIDAVGNLTTTNLGISSAVNYMQVQPPIGRIISNTSILFDPPLSSGTLSQITNTPTNTASMLYSSTIVLGSVYLTTDPIDANIPIAVGTNDPRMTNARTPLPHIQPASTITVNTIGTMIPYPVDLQTLLASVAYTSGFVMSGNITVPVGNTINVLNSPVNPTDIVNKQYVDNAIAGIHVSNTDTITTVQSQTIGVIISVPTTSNTPTYTHKFVVEVTNQQNNVAQSFELMTMVKNITTTYFTMYGILGDFIPFTIEVQANNSSMIVVFTNITTYAVNINIQQIL
jgi:hypothetical protein